MPQHNLTDCPESLQLLTFGLQHLYSVFSTVQLSHMIRNYIINVCVLLNICCSKLDIFEWFLDKKKMNGLMNYGKILQHIRYSLNKEHFASAGNHCITMYHLLDNWP